MKKCKVDVCEREHAARGYCRVHWEWANRRNFEEEPSYKIGSLRRQEAPENCKVEGCERTDHEARGYCTSHYAWARRRNFEKEPTHSIGESFVGDTWHKKPNIEIDNLSDEELGWVAGIIDGEGHIRGKQDENSTPMVRVTMTDKEAIDKLQNLISSPADITIDDRENRPGNRKTAYTWGLYGKHNILEFLHAIRPLCSIKEEQIKEVFNYYESDAS